MHFFFGLPPQCFCVRACFVCACVSTFASAATRAHSLIPLRAEERKCEAVSDIPGVCVCVCLGQGGVFTAV